MTTIHRTRPAIERRGLGRHLAGLATCVLALVATPAARAVLPSDLGPGPTVRTLKVPAPKHWLWVMDFVFPHMADGMVYLLDGDSGQYLGTLSTGYSFAKLTPSHDGKLLYSPETYFSRGTRGTRTDVVTIYDASTLSPVGEVPIPAKRSSNLPNVGNSVLTDDGRFLLIFNFNPGSSVSVVDTASRQFVGEIETPGCALIYPTGPRSFFTLCGDGGALVVELDDKGAATRQTRTEPLFAIDKDPITEKGVRLGDTTYFVTFDGRVVPLRASGGTLKAGESWPLTTAAERQAGWRPGGLQQLAVHAGMNRLYAIMHQGPRDTHKDPGKTVWVYDLATHQRVQKVTFPGLVASVQLSTDDKPLLYGMLGDAQTLYVHDGKSGAHLRTLQPLGTTPTLLIVP